jgi:hypothetical protein
MSEVLLASINLATAHFERGDDDEWRKVIADTHESYTHHLAEVEERAAEIKP